MNGSISIKTAREVALMRRAGSIVAGALELAGQLIVPGVTPAHVDAELGKYIRSFNAIPSFLGYGGFPAQCCISVNDAVVHGIPGHVPLKEGDIAGVDVGAILDGYHGDGARCFAVGAISAQAQKLLDVTQQCLNAGMAMAKEGNRIGDISNAVEQTAKQAGFSVVRALVGHGIGSEMHEPPDVPNYGRPGRGIRLEAGMTIAIEPMVNVGGYDVRVLDDDWTVVTADGSLSAQFEHTVLITHDGCEILTRLT